ncbi:MAG: hypothetical protein E6J88_09850 [Deltaproteobacteria bacterium]|nr:MAG: hypothetical protein E6J88_09850 [Deltaproteobacteria bacterium]
MHGWESESNLLFASHFFSYAATAVAVTYANAYARAGVNANLCNYSFGAVDGVTTGNPAPAPPAGVLSLFGNGNGVPPTGPLQLIDNASLNGPKRDQVATSPSSTVGQDYNTDGVACLRSLWTGQDNAGAALTGSALAQSQAVHAGVNEVLRSGKLHGVPTILVQGRSDALVPVNHASRAYLGANKMADGADSPTVYYEVTNAQHFDTFLGISTLTALAGRFVPLHRYVIQSLDLMYAHLKDKAALPPSQVVRTTPRGFQGNGTTPNAITPANEPPIPAAPAAADQITFSNGTLHIPD